MMMSSDNYPETATAGNAGRLLADLPRGALIDLYVNALARLHSGDADAAVEDTPIDEALVAADAAPMLRLRGDQVPRWMTREERWWLEPCQGQHSVRWCEGCAEIEDERGAVAEQAHEDSLRGEL